MSLALLFATLTQVREPGLPIGWDCGTSLLDNQARSFHVKQNVVQSLATASPLFVGERPA